MGRGQGRYTERGRVAAGALVVVVVLAAGTAAIATWSGAVWAFEVTVVLGIVIGIVVAFGGLDGRVLLRQRSRRRDAAALDAVPWVARATASQLERLDPVEHRKLDLGAPWPVIVVGPTGVSVVAVAGGDPRAAVTRIEQVVSLVAAITSELGAERRIEVRGLLVVAPGRSSPAPTKVRCVTPAQLASSFAHGSLVPMSTVTALFTRLSGALAPDLHLDAS